MENDHYLVCSSVSRIIALDLTDVRETMRPLPVTALIGAPAFVRGLAMIRGIATPVIAADALFAADVGQTYPPVVAQPRFVTIVSGNRPVALLVEHVHGVRRLSASLRTDIPRLAQGTASGVLHEVGILDERLLFILNMAHLVPSGTWRAIEQCVTA